MADLKWTLRTDLTSRKMCARAKMRTDNTWFSLPQWQTLYVDTVPTPKTLLVIHYLMGASNILGPIRTDKPEVTIRKHQLPSFSVSSIKPLYLTPLSLPFFILLHTFPLFFHSRMHTLAPVSLFLNGGSCVTLHTPLLSPISFIVLFLPEKHLHLCSHHHSVQWARYYSSFLLSLACHFPDPKRHSIGQVPSPGGSLRFRL